MDDVAKVAAGLVEVVGEQGHSVFVNPALVVVVESSWTNSMGVRWSTITLSTGREITARGDFREVAQNLSCANHLKEQTDAR
jgi:hypothetical protein